MNLFGRARGSVDPVPGEEAVVAGQQAGHYAEQPRLAAVPGADAVGEDSLAGYRILRKLGHGQRADVYLGVVAGGGQHSSLPAHAVVKLLTRSASVAGAEQEVEAISRSHHDHVVRIIDVATTGDGRWCLLMERLPHGSLAQLLDARAVVSPGEAVTVLAPIAGAVDVLHSRGVCHGAISASSLLFSDAGAPVLARFGNATLMQAEQSAAALSARADVTADRLGLSRLARAVLERTGPGIAVDMCDWLTECEREGFPDSFGTELADRLFTLAEPQAVSLLRGHARGGSAGDSTSDAVRDVLASGIPSRAVGLYESAGQHPQPEPPALSGALQPIVRADAAGTRHDWLAVAHLPEPLESFVSRLIARAAEALAIVGPSFSRAVAAVRAVRRPLWLLAGAVMLALVVVLAVAVNDSNATDEPGESGGSGQSEQSQDDAASDDERLAGADQTANRTTTETDRAAAAVLGDDPVTAAEVLLGARERCLAELSILCLDAVLQQGSAAMDNDVNLIRAAQDGAGLPFDAEIVYGELSLVERLGDSALVGLAAGVSVEGTREPASVLLMKGEAGWRIRSYIQ